MGSIGGSRGDTYARIGGGAVSAVCAVLLAAGCGGGTKQHTTTTAPNPVATTPVAPAVAAPLRQRVLSSGQLAGMVTAPGAAVISDVNQWVSGQNLPSSAQTKAEVARLKGLGFVAALPENLTTTGNMDRFGLSVVEQFKSTAGPKAEVAYATVRNGPWVKFAAPGIPGAVAFEQTGGAGGGRNVAFADGNYFYLVGDGWNTSSKDAVPRDQLIAAALLLYRRVHGLPGG